MSQKSFTTYTKIQSEKDDEQTSNGSHQSESKKNPIEDLGIAPLKPGPGVPAG